ncbi:MAG: hypothetical protein FD180_5000, partial [Planctomycetota bacterium]
MRLAPLLALLSLPAFAEVLSPTLRVERSGENLVLRLEGTADIPRATADWAPLVEIEYLFVPLRVERRIRRIPGILRWTEQRVTAGTEITLGFGRARVLSDAVEDNPPYIEARPFVVAGQFAGIYRARLVLDPARQRIRARSIPAAAASAETSWGDPADFARRSREMRLEIEGDAAALQRLARDLESLWDPWRAAPHPGEKWSEGIKSWRARLEPLPARNDRRPANAIVEYMPAARSAIGEACESLAALADARERSMEKSAELRLASRE